MTRFLLIYTGAFICPPPIKASCLYHPDSCHRPPGCPTIILPCCRILPYHLFLKSLNLDSVDSQYLIFYIGRAHRKHGPSSHVQGHFRHVMEIIHVTGSQGERLTDTITLQHIRGSTIISGSLRVNECLELVPPVRDIEIDHADTIGVIRSILRLCLFL